MQRDIRTDANPFMENTPSTGDTCARHRASSTRFASFPHQPWAIEIVSGCGREDRVAVEGGMTKTDLCPGDSAPLQWIIGVIEVEAYIGAGLHLNLSLAESLWMCLHCSWGFVLPRTDRQTCTNSAPSSTLKIAM